MDPLTALGLASNIIQFVDFASKLFSTTKRLYVSQSGASAEHLELESLARHIKKLAEGAKPRNSPGSKIISDEDNTLIDLGNQCVAVSRELLGVLNSLKLKGGHTRSWDSFVQALRTEWKKDDIESLQRRLDRMSNQLNARILLDQQAEVVSKLYEIASDNRRLEAKRTCEIDCLREDFQKLFKKIEEGLQKDGAEIRTLALLSDAVEKGVGYSSELTILDFIRFDTIDDRQIGVRKAHEQTFSWIFRNQPSPSQPRNAQNFGEWLQSDNTLFWVTGKPGSGKSTLMKFICEHKDTATNLETWAKGRQLIVAQFFFWNAGRQALQKSQEGLLRSILYQILRQTPDLIPYASPALWKALISGKSRLPTASQSLSTPQLLDAFQVVSTHLGESKARFCFFIDGVDEYDGKPNDIIRLIELLKSTLQVKLCVSSRPWNEFEKAFGQDQPMKLYMQDLTTNDIRSYIADTLEKDTGFQELKQRDNRYGDLVQDILDAARGVFLWVILVVRSLLEGLTNADRIVDLQRRLRLLPTDLNEFFERVLFTVDNFYRKETAQMFQVTFIAHDALPLMSYWYMDQEVSFLENLKAGPVSNAIIDGRLAQMRKRLNACCKGLLEVHSIESSGGREDFFYLKVDFLHRTVRDFLRDPDMHNMLGKWVGTDFDANIAICQSLIAQVKTAPQERSYYNIGGGLAKIISLFFGHASVLEDSQYPLTLEVRLLDDLVIALARHKSYIGDVGSLFSISGRGVRNSSGDPGYLVLEEAVQNRFHRYVSKKLDEWPSLPVIQQAELLQCALFPVASRPVSVPRLPMVVLLLEKGCGYHGPNGDLRDDAVIDKTPWIGFLEIEYEYLQEGRSLEDALPIIKHMLSHGADLNAVCVLRDAPGGRRRLRHKASEVVRMLITDFDARALGDLLTRTTDSQQEKSDRSRRKRFISMIFRGKRK